MEFATRNSVGSRYAATAGKKVLKTTLSSRVQAGKAPHAVDAADAVPAKRAQEHHTALAKCARAPNPVLKKWIVSALRVIIFPSKVFDWLTI